MSKKIERNYLEITSLKDLNYSNQIPSGITISLVQPQDFQLNKFFYKNVGKKHNWVDRLIWTENQWIKYTSDEKVKTYVLKKNQNKNLGSCLLSSAIRSSFLNKPRRVWLHTCSLDHKNALTNYIARGMKIFKKETITL